MKRVSIYVKCSIFLTFFVLGNFRLFSQHLPEALLRTPVFVEMDNGYGSGFYIQDSMHTYFVTAKHVLVSEIKFDNKTKKDTIILSTQKLNCFSYPIDPSLGEGRKLTINLVEALKQGLLKVQTNSDIAVIQLGDNNSVNENLSLTTYYPFVDKDKSSYMENIPIEVLLGYKWVHVGDDVFVFGYPTSIGIQESPQFDYMRPLLRKGIIAGKFDIQKTIIIDCPSYYGNSGGPVFERYYGNGGDIYYKLIGLISQFIPYKEDWVNQNNGLTNITVANSGYSVVCPIDGILQLIKK